MKVYKTNLCVDCYTDISCQASRCRPCADKYQSIALNGRIPKNLDYINSLPKSEKFMKVLKERLSGSNHHMWKGGISKTKEYIRMASKTRKALSKRFKVTKKNKVVKRSTGQDHFNARESGKQKRGKRLDKTVSEADAKNIRHMLSA